MNQFTEIKAGVAAMVGALSMIWGWLGWLVVGWVVCMAIDYISGSAAAAKAGEWSSAKARDGIWHKAGLILNVWLGLDIWDYSNLPLNLCGQICLWYSALWYVLCLVFIPVFDWLRYWVQGGERPHYSFL